MQIFCKKPQSNIYHYRHLKKREAPPNKKDLYKDITARTKIQAKLETDPKLAATPDKHKPDRSKEAQAGILPP